MVEFLQLTGKQAVIDWMAANTTCPNTMVDRITPRPAADLRPVSKRKPALTIRRR